jgi:hypothetical protein
MINALRPLTEEQRQAAWQAAAMRAAGSRPDGCRQRAKRKREHCQTRRDRVNPVR